MAVNCLYGIKCSIEMMNFRYVSICMHCTRMRIPYSLNRSTRRRVRHASNPGWSPYFSVRESNIAENQMYSLEKIECVHHRHVLLTFQARPGLVQLTSEVRP